MFGHFSSFCSQKLKKKNKQETTHLERLSADPWVVEWWKTISQNSCFSSSYANDNKIVKKNWKFLLKSSQVRWLKGNATIWLLTFQHGIQLADRAPVSCNCARAMSIPRPLMDSCLLRVLRGLRARVTGTRTSCRIREKADVVLE